MGTVAESQKVSATAVQTTCCAPARVPQHHLQRHRNHQVQPCSVPWPPFGLVAQLEQQVERVCAKAQCKVASFRHGRRDVSMTGRRMLYLTIVQSTLDYASTCYVHCLSAKLRDKLESTSNICLRRVFGHDQYTSIDCILTKYNLYTFSRRVNLKLFVFVFRCLSRCTSPLLSTIFTPALHHAAQMLLPAVKLQPL